MRRNGARFGRRSVAQSSATAALAWPLQMALIYPTMAWFDPRRGVTLNGSNVSAWTDQISGYSLAQATGGSQPAFSSTGLNGTPSIGTAAGAQYLTGASSLAAAIGGTAAHTAMANIKSPGGGAWLLSAGLTASSTNIIEILALTTNTPRYGRSGGATSQGVLTLTANNYYTQTAVFSAGTAKMWRDTTAEAGNPFTNSSSVACDLLIVGGRWRLAAADVSWGGLWGDVVIIPGALDDTQVAAGQAWMASRRV